MGMGHLQVEMRLCCYFVSISLHFAKGWYRKNTNGMLSFYHSPLFRGFRNSILSFHIVNQSVRRHFMISGPKPNCSNQNTNHSFPKKLFQLQVIFQILIQNQTLQCLCITDTHLNPIAYAISSSCGSKVHDTSSIIFSSLLNIAFCTS